MVRTQIGSPPAAARPALVTCAGRDPRPLLQQDGRALASAAMAVASALLGCCSR